MEHGTTPSVFCILIVLSCLATNTFAQESFQAGTRTGGTSGLTGKYFFEPATALEGVAGKFGNGYSVTMLIERYEQIYYVKGLYVYHGAGLHAAVYDGDNRYGKYYRFLGRDTRRATDELGFGLNLIVGAEYRLGHHIPLVFTADLKPFVEVGRGGGVAIAPDPSIGIRVILK
jgi:hypothetical protein